MTVKTLLIEYDDANGDVMGGYPLRAPAVEVVRCRDCKHFEVDQSDHEYRSGWWCKRWNTDMVTPDGFCAWGERKTVS